MLENRYPFSGRQARSPRTSQKARAAEDLTLIRKLPTMPGKECTRATATKRALVPKKKRR